MRPAVTAGVVFLLALGPALAQSNTASISGHVLAPSGHTVRAMVTLQPATPRGVPSPSHRRRTAGDGSFTFQNLAAGQYRLCAQILQSEAARSAPPFLDTCSWGSSNGVIAVAAGQQLTGINFAAPNGTLLQIRVNDPQQLLPQVIAVKGPPTLEPQLQLVVKGPDKRIHHAQFVSKDAGGRTYRMVVPLSTALGVTITSLGRQALRFHRQPCQGGGRLAGRAGRGPRLFKLHVAELASAAYV